MKIREGECFILWKSWVNIKVLRPNFKVSSGTSSGHLFHIQYEEHSNQHLLHFVTVESRSNPLPYEGLDF